MAKFHFEILFSTQYINLVTGEISKIKAVIRSPISRFIIQKERHTSIPHNIKLSLTKSSIPFFSIRLYIIYLDVYNNVYHVRISLFFEKMFFQSSFKHIVLDEQMPLILKKMSFLFGVFTILMDHFVLFLNILI